MQRPRILVVGDVSVEQNVIAESFPDYRGYCVAESLDCVPSGNGILGAIALARLGSDSVFCTALGNDAYGTELVDYLKYERVDTRFVNVKKGFDTAIEIVINGKRGVERIFCKGATGSLTASDIEAAFVSYPDAVLLNGRVGAEAFNSTLKLAGENGIPVFVSSLPDPSELDPAEIGECEILTVNFDEAFAVTGIRPSNQEGCMRACISLMQKIKAKYVIIRLEERGSFLFDGTYYNFYSAIDVPDVSGVSSDCAFSSALCLEYVKSDADIRRSCDVATVAAAVYMTEGGGPLAYPRYSDIKRFVEQNGLDIDFD